MEEMAVSFTALAERWASPEAELDTAEFTQSAHGMGAILSAVGGPAFGFAAVDYNKKCDSLRDAAAARPEARTLQAIVAADAASGTLRTQGSLARNLWRVLNALRFCRELFVGILPAAGAGAEQSADAEKVSLSAVAWTAYEHTMAQTHLWSIRQIVGLAMWAVPSRDVFIETLARQTPGGTPAAIASAHAYVAASAVVIARLEALFTAPCVDENGA